MKLGLDFGTTNSSAALYQDGELTIVRSPAIEPSGILPSLMYITREHDAILGKEAARRYLRDDTGRPADWQTRSAGYLEYWSGMPEGESEYIVQEIFVQEDTGAKGRLLQSIKTALRNPSYQGTQIFKRYYKLEELITLLLAELRSAAVDTAGTPIDTVLMGRPVRITGSRRDDDRAEAILRKAAQEAGFADIAFLAEPIAAAYNYHTRLNDRTTVLVFDFGGGTLDMTVARIGGTERPQVLATHGLLIGGDDFDKRIMEKFLWGHFGYGKPYEGDKRLSYEVYDYLLDWARHPDLTRHMYYRDIKRAATVTKAGPEFTALYTLINNKYGFKLFEIIEQAKIALSTQKAVTLTFEADDIYIHQPITRTQFTRAIQDYLDEIDGAAAGVVRAAQLADSDIDLVLCTGGSSAIPAIQDLLAARFGADRVRPHNPFLSVSSGLAVAAAYNGHFG
jgi:hypothetical chaperone protein